MECDEQNVEWASVNLGILLCEFCSGRHRQLGTHISRVRSLKLDTKVWTPSVIEEMKLRGNANAKQYFEARVPLYAIKPPRDMGPVVIENWIRAKYEDKKYVDPNQPNAIYGDSLPPGHHFNSPDMDDIKLDSQQSKSISASLNFAVHTMPCSPMCATLKWITPSNDTKTQLLVLHGRFLSRYSSPSSQRSEQLIDITKHAVWISESEINKPLVLSIGDDNDGMRFQFDSYVEIVRWTQNIRRSALFYQELASDMCAETVNKTVSALLACSLSELDNSSVYKHLEYGQTKKQSKFSIGWDKKWWSINMKRKILIYFAKDPRTMKPKKNTMFIQAQGGFYLNEIIVDIDDKKFRSGQEHCLLLYHFQKTIFIKFDQRWPLIQFWKQFHIKPRDVKYLGDKPAFYEKALIQQNVDIQVMALKSPKNHANTDKMPEPTVSTVQMEPAADPMSGSILASPPLPAEFMGDASIDNEMGMGIGTAILNHEMLLQDSRMEIDDINPKHKNENAERRYSASDEDDDDEKEPRRDSDDPMQLLNNPIVSQPALPAHMKQKSSLHFVLQSQFKGQYIHNDANLSDDEDDQGTPHHGFDDSMELELQRTKQGAGDGSIVHYVPKMRSAQSDSYAESLKDEFGVLENENTAPSRLTIFQQHQEEQQQELQQKQQQVQKAQEMQQQKSTSPVSANNVLSPELPNQYLEAASLPDQYAFALEADEDDNVQLQMMNNSKPLPYAQLNGVKAAPIQISQSRSARSSAPDLSGNSDDEDGYAANDDEIEIQNAEKAEDPMPKKHPNKQKVLSMDAMDPLNDIPDFPDDVDIDSPRGDDNDSMKRHRFGAFENKTITDPPSGFDHMVIIQQSHETGNSESNTLNPDEMQLPRQPSNESQASDVSEEGDVMYKDHRRGTVNMYAERNKYASRTYRDFIKGKSIDPHKVNFKHEIKHQAKIAEHEDSKSQMQEKQSPHRLVLKPIESNVSDSGSANHAALADMSRQYLLNAMQVRKLTDTQTMQSLLIQVGSMASFFVQPGNKLFVHLHGVNAPSSNLNDSNYNGTAYNTSQIWEHVEGLLQEKIGGHLELIELNAMN